MKTTEISPAFLAFTLAAAVSMAGCSDDESSDTTRAAAGGAAGGAEPGNSGGAAGDGVAAGGGGAAAGGGAAGSGGAAECEWASQFEDDFNRSDGDPGDDYDVQAMGEGSELVVLDNKLFAQAQYYGLTPLDEVGQGPTRVSVDFVIDPFSDVESGTSFGVGFGQSESDGSIVGYYCLVDLATNSLQLSKIATQVGEPDMDTTTYDEGSVDWAAGTEYKLTFTVDEGKLGATLSSGADSIVELSGSDDEPLTTGTIGINGMGTEAFATHFDNLLIEVCE